MPAGQTVEGGSRWEEDGGGGLCSQVVAKALGFESAEE